MWRIPKVIDILLEDAPQNIKIILIQIEEAHTNAWPIGRSHQPDNHKSHEDRMNAAKDFINVTLDFKTRPELMKYFEVYVDIFPENAYELRFRAWPDKYYLLDANRTVLKKSEYNHDTMVDGLIIEDWLNLVCN